ncbi:DNA replication ATP-dependent helicase Dna2 [Microbacterium sp. W4I4]|uniref:DEAD/DEAH box helicase n=1 Tax=Microbacterium sp. W4I4 TaxID=3042295 RepID=UPI0027871D27|nr:ATP-binding protein [Microbacterium sp. W4I4]MDQ0614031.1 DNA replication ATP-dependent helicase Dna2 [Microbacterium sp. W4I4]
MTITQFVGSGCERQLRLSMHPDSGTFVHERQALDLPHRQVRPALRGIQDAGDEWGQAKVHDLQEAFGAGNLLGGSFAVTGSTTQPGLSYTATPLEPFLVAGVAPGQFLIETEFLADTPTFRLAHKLDAIAFAETSGPLQFTRVRPDVIEVLEADDALLGDKGVAVNGDIVPIEVADPRLGLRIIDVKLTSEPGPRYFAELAYYALTLAAFLEDVGLDDRYFVSAYPAIWPGSESESALHAAAAAGAAAADRYAGFHEDLETVPMRTFLAQVRRVLHVDIPHVLGERLADLPWSVTPACQGCENLGQKFSTTPGTSGSAWDARHCLPQAEAEQHLSRVPFLTRGAFQILRTHGTSTVTDLAGLDTTDETFDLHHRLRGQRQIVSRRAQALGGNSVVPLDSSLYTTAAIPSWARLRIYITADFDPGSALSLSFGLSWAWMQRGWQPSSISRTRVHHTDQKSADAEWDALSGLLDDLAALIDECTTHDRTQSMQVYVWDTVTFEHMTRVVGRHLARILASGRLQRLVWLFPPEEVLDSPALTEAPAVSIVRNAAKATLAVDLAHTYTLLGVARKLQDPNSPYPYNVPMFWEDPFTDQIPPERAHQLWNPRRAPSAPTPAELSGRLLQTVKTKLRALSDVTDALTTAFGDRISRKAPLLRQLSAPTLQNATSPLGVLLVAYSKLDRAVAKLDQAQIRALPTDEKEAKFETAVMTALQGPDRDAELTRLGLPHLPQRMVFRLRPGSVDVKVKPGEFLWAVVPEMLAMDLDTTINSFVRRVNNAQLSAWWDGINDFRTTLGDVLGATIVNIDRHEATLVADLDTWGIRTEIRRRLGQARAFGGHGPLTLEAVNRDFFVRRLEEATKAIGNPPASGRDPLVDSALGRAVRPRTGPAHPAGDLLWNAAALNATTVARDMQVLRAAMPATFAGLNASQDSAWESALSRRVTLIWGPPGTGKTATVRSILQGFAVTGRPLRVAIAAFTYTAIDTVLQGLLPALPSNVLVRRLSSGARATPDWLPPQMDVRRRTPEFDELIDDLGSGQPMFVFGTTEQLHAAIETRDARGTRGTFDVIIFDEAGQLDVAHATLLLSGANNGAQLIVAGDHLQLAPIHAAEPPLGLENKVGSIYNYLLHDQGVPQEQLLVNYRSNATLVELGKLAGYPDALRAERPDLRIQYRDDVSLDDVRIELALSEDLVAVADPDRVAVTVTYLEGVSGQWNDFEAMTIADLVRWYHSTLVRGLSSAGTSSMTDEYFWTEAIGVVSLHRAQRSRIIELLRAAFVTASSDPRLPGWIESAVDTVERFQGQERDIILATYAVGDPDTVAEEEDFLHNLNRFNVLATRARAKLIVMASREIIQHTSNDLETIRTSEMLKDFVDVFCSNELLVDLPSPEGDVTTELRWRT